MGIGARSFGVLGWSLVLFWWALAAGPVAAESGPPPLRVIVTLDVPAVAEAQLSSALQVTDQRARIERRRSRLERALAGQVRVLRRFEKLPFLVLEVPHAALARLAARAEVAEIAGDPWLRPQLMDSTQLIQAPVPWDRGFDGTGWHVAVLDTGVDRDHPALAGRIDAEACFSWGDCPGGGNEAYGPGSAAPCTSPGCGHGTHVAGIAAGDDAAFSGVAPGARLIPVQVFTNEAGAICGGAGIECPLAYASDIVSGLNYIYDLRGDYQIAAVNMSLSGGAYTSQETCDLENVATRMAIENLRAVGIATVIASGNGGYLNAIGHPACLSPAVSVGSVTKSGQVSSFSNSADFLDLLAPGSSIVSARVGGGFGASSGTSMASPHVAGAWALYRELQPQASVHAVLGALKESDWPVLDPGNGLEHPLVRLEAFFVPEPGEAATALAAALALGWLGRRRLRPVPGR